MSNPFETDDDEVESRFEPSLRVQSSQTRSRRAPPAVTFSQPQPSITEEHVRATAATPTSPFDLDDDDLNFGQPQDSTPDSFPEAPEAMYPGTLRANRNSVIEKEESVHEDASYVRSSYDDSYGMSADNSQLPFQPQQQSEMPSPFPQVNSVFQPFQRDLDEPEVAGVSGFVAEEKKQEPRQRSGTTIGANRVKLLNGKYYSFDYPVSRRLKSKIPFQGARDLSEFKYLRYHAITADPKLYDKDMEVTASIEDYPLRPKCYAVPRETELMIVCTMYNEDEVLLARTLKGVFKNIKTMYNDGSAFFGHDAWKKIVVVVVADGRGKLNSRAKSFMTLLGCYQEGLIQEAVNDEPVKAHLFEYTTPFGIGHFKYDGSSKNVKVPLVTEQTVPVQMMFLVKEQNAGKINSHRWALRFLCPNLNPRVISLIDVGTEPGPDAIYKLWKSFRDPHVGGSCGEIRAMLGTHASANDEKSVMGKFLLFISCKIIDLWKCICNPLVAAQNFEYKTSNDLDKPCESFWGFISVLPGAFSAYRYSALQGDPLDAYFHGEDMKSDTSKPAGILESNMYLAEDRILCYQLVSKPNSRNLLRYVHDSYATTDVPSSVDEFVNQRRRWLNGSFFAALYSLIHFYRIFRSSHPFGRKLMLIFEMLFQFLSIILSWFALASYFLIFRILTLQVIGTSIGYHAGNILGIVFLWIYIIALALTFIISFGNKPSENKRLYQLAFLLFGVIAIYMLFCVICLTIDAVQGIQQSTTGSVLSYFKNSTFRDLTISLASTYLLYAASSLLFGDFFHIIACTIPYLLISPSFVNILSIYAFCNIDDISWGTKGAIKVDSAKKSAMKVTAATGETDEMVLSDPLKDPDEFYNEAERDLESGSDDSKKNSNAIKESRSNYAKGRTYTVLLWLVSNFALLVVVLRTGGLDDYISIHDDGMTSITGSSSSTTSTSAISKRQYDSETASMFMTVILWIMAFMALYRFVSCVLYRIDFAVRHRRYKRAPINF